MKSVAQPLNQSKRMSAASVNRRSAAKCVLLASFIVACDRTRVIPVEPRPVGRTAAVRVHPERPEEKHLHDLARAIPGFAGYLLEGETLVGFVTDLKSEDKLRAWLTQRMNEDAAKHGRPRLRSVVVRKVDFDFQSLAEWREVATDQLLGKLAGVASLSADLETNKLLIGADLATYPELRATVVSSLTRLGVPRDAITFRQMKPIRTQSARIGTNTAVAPTASFANTTLLVQPVPIAGGYVAWMCPASVEM